MDPGTFIQLLPVADYRVLAVHLALGVMLAAGFILRRSLAAWPCWLAAFTYAVLVEVLWAAQGLPREVGLASLLDMMLIPTALGLLARRQIIPGLRRSQWTAQDRRRWLTQQGLAASPPRSLNALLATLASARNINEPIDNDKDSTRIRRESFGKRG